MPGQRPHSLIHMCSPLSDPSTFICSCTQAQPVLDVSTFQRVVETQRRHILIGDGLIRLSRVIASVCRSISASTSKTMVSSSVALDDFLTLLHIVVLLFLVFDVTRVPLVEHASEALLQFSFEAHPAPLFSDAD